MRLRLFALVLVFAGFALGSASAAPFTQRFVSVRARLVAMRDALVAPLPKPDAKRRAAIEKLIAAIDADSASLTKDVATAKTVTSAAAGPFRTDAELPGAVRTLLTALGSDVRTRLDTLSAALSAAIGAKLEQKGPALLAKATDALDDAAAEDELKAIVADLTKAAKAADSLERAIDADSGGGGGGDGCTSFPAAGAHLDVTGTGGYHKILDEDGTIDATDFGGGQTGVEYGDQVYAGFSMTVSVAPASLQEGAPPLLFVQYSGGPGKYYMLTPGAGVTVAKASPDRVAFCVDAVLPAEFPESLGPGEPLEVQVKGYVVIKR